MAERPHDVIVVGGGPAGSATARRLALGGHRVLLLDRARFPRDKACSEYASPEAVRQLAALGVLPAVEAFGTTALTGSAVTGARGGQMHGRFDAAGGAPFRATGLALPRRALDATLLDAARAAGVTVREGATMRGFDRAGDGTVTVAFDVGGGEHTVTGRLLIGADGLRSRVARAAGLRQQGRLRRTAFVAHVSDVAGLAGHAELHVGRAGYVGLNPLSADVANVALVVPAARAHEARGDVAGFVARTLESFPEVRGRVDLDRTVRAILTTGPFDASCRRSVADGVLLVGDAAEFFDPFTGEGIWSALLGAELAAAAAAALAAPGAVTARRLASYRSARRRAFGEKWIVERLIGYAMLAPALFDASLRLLEHTGRAHRMIGVTGGFVPVRRLVFG